MANSGEVNKVFYIYGDNANSVLDRFLRRDDNRFYKAPIKESEDTYNFLVVDVDQAVSDGLVNWIKEIPEAFSPIVFLVNGSAHNAGIAHTYSILSKKFGENSIFEIQNHEHLHSILGALSELENGFSVMTVDICDFLAFLDKGQHYWSDLISANSTQELASVSKERLEVVKEKADKLGLNLTGIFGCIRKELANYTLEDYQAITNAVMDSEVFETFSSELVIHTNLSEKMFSDDIDKTEFHMLFILSEKQPL
ncbi:hypothetical protein GCM10009128_24790 [Psychrosphaera haliotis]|uniref:hypothetical protein n=1 Tax=Psychrosphaera haliotis TaxID=555083 RepID=UPI0031DF72A4